MDQLDKIFGTQAHYMRALRPIYEANGFGWHGQFPYPIDERWSQEGFRLLAWRITEEIGELIDARIRGKPQDDIYEEAADVFHFLVELCICAGVTKFDLYGDTSLVDIFGRLSVPFTDFKSQNSAWVNVIFQLTTAMYNFRQRPWRTDNRPTDRAKLTLALRYLFDDYFKACKAIGLDAFSLCNFYYEKSAINAERRRQAESGI